MKNFNHYGHSVRGVAVELNGDVISVSGVLHSSPLQAFSFMKDELRKHPKTIVKVILGFKDILKHYTMPVYAKCSVKENSVTRQIPSIEPPG